MEFTTIFLVWVNDNVINVTTTRELALRIADKYIQEHREGQWLEAYSGRWYQRDGPVARLWIEERILEGGQ